MITDSGAAGHEAVDHTSSKSQSTRKKRFKARCAFELTLNVKSLSRLYEALIGLIIDKKAGDPNRSPKL
jgi:hypothetical protein